MKKFFNRFAIFIPFLILIALRIPSLFESYWYGDEGIYAAVAQELSRGKNLYAQTWDHKPPLIFWTFLIGALTGWNAGFVFLRAINILLGILTLLGINLILKKIKISLFPRFAALIFLSFFLGSTILEGNVVNAEVIFIVFNVFFFLLMLSKKHFVLAGFLAFLSLITKVPGFVEIGLISLSFAFVWAKQKNFKFILISAFKTIAGFSFPLILMIAYFWLNKTMDSFYYANFAFNRIYSLHEGNIIRLLGSDVPSTYLQVASVALIFVFSSILYLRKSISSFLFLLVNLITAQFFASLLSAKNYGHYFIQLLPGITLLLSFFLQKAKETSLFSKVLSREKTKKLAHGKKSTDQSKINLATRTKPFLITAFFIVLLSPLVFVFKKGGKIPVYSKPGEYYELFVRGYILNNESAKEKFWWVEGEGVKKTVNWAKHLENNYPEYDLMYIYTDKPWILALTNRAFTNKYVAWFHLAYRDEHLQEELENIKRADIVVIDNDIEVIPAVYNQVKKEFEKFDTFENLDIFRRVKLSELTLGAKSSEAKYFSLLSTI